MKFHKLRILQIIHKPQHRGAEIFTSQLSNHLVAEGHEVKILAIFNGDANLPYKGEITCLNGSLNNRFFDLKGWRKLAKIVRYYKPDVVQANAGDTLKYAVLSKILFRWKTPIIFRNASEVGRYLSSTFQKAYNTLLYQKVDMIASVSKASEKDLLRHFPFLKGKTQIIPIGMEEFDEIPPVQLKPALVKHIVHVGGFSFEKNHKGLLRIFRAVLKDEDRVHLHLVGDGPLRKEIEVEVKNLGLEPFVSFYGFVSNPLSYINAADVLILPSIIEGLPGVILEAMYCKTPVVAYDVGGISEIVNSETGHLIEKNKEEDFAQAVSAVLIDPDPVEIFHAYEMVRMKFMNEDIALKFVNIYRKLVDGGE